MVLRQISGRLQKKRELEFSPVYTFHKPTVAANSGLVFTSSEAGTRVDSLDPDGAAAGCGLQHGDVVVSINKKKVKSATQAATMLQWLKGEIKVVVSSTSPHEKGSMV